MHHTKEQDVVNAKNKLSELKSVYVTSIMNYIEHSKNSTYNGLSEILDCQRKGSEYFNYAEEFVGNSDLLGAHNSPLWAQGFAEDCVEILKSMPQHFKLLNDGFSKANLETNNILPSGTAYANMQRMVTKYLTVSEINDIKSNFTESQLPIYGFNNQAREFMSKKLQTILSYGFGVIFVIVLLVISFIQPTPSSFQYSVFRTVLALAGAGAVAVFPGFIEVKLGDWLRAGGALAVFVVLYFFNPVLPDKEASISELKVAVFSSYDHGQRVIDEKIKDSSLTKADHDVLLRIKNEYDTEVKEAKKALEEDKFNLWREKNNLIKEIIDTNDAKKYLPDDLKNRVGNNIPPDRPIIRDFIDSNRRITG